MKTPHTVKSLLVCLVLSAGFAQAQAPTEDALLWRIEGKNGTAPSYLYGTIHLICPNDFSLSDTLKGCLSQTDQLTLELDMDDPGMMMAMVKTMGMNEGTQLKNLLPAPDYDRLGQYFRDSVKMSIAPFERAKPFVLMSIVLNRVLACQPQSYEMELMGLAKKRKVEVVGLESVEEQMAVFDSIPYTDQAKMVLSLIDSLPQARREFDQMVALYKSKDLDGLYKMTLKSAFGMESNQKVLLTDRNERWIPLIEKQVAEKPTFIAVGAAHLGGDTGVVALLRKQGYDVRAVLEE